ncbi:MAG: T9SS type A sorting domain-containing protein [Cytophagales bacterium]|nr:T9SS type A sorting domain-containing protein [Cytophagales bacterium]
MRKTILLLLFGFLVPGWLLAQETQAQKPVKGDGTKDNPYQLENLAHLRWLSEGLKGGMTDQERWKEKHYKLTANIDASETAQWNGGKGFSPIGKSAVNAFSGTFNGKGHFITGLTVNRPNDDYTGFFGYFACFYSYLKLQRLQLLKVQITGSNFVGGLVGCVESGTVELCSISGTVDGDNSVGGLIGTNFSGSINHSYSLASVAGKTKTGGLVGRNCSSINNTYAAGEVSGLGTDAKDIGGLVGKNEKSAYITSSYWDKETTKQNTSAGSKAECGLRTADFADPKGFAQWDFEKTWEVRALSTDGIKRPYLIEDLYPHSTEIRISPSGMPVSVKGNRLYNIGEQATLSVEVPPGCRFVKWTANGQEIEGAKSSFTYKVTKDSPEEYTAYFAEDWQFAGGDGSEANPYQITTLKQLSFLCYAPSLLDKHFALQNDIDASETAQWNDGKGFMPIRDFKGTFDGKGYAISNLTINRPKRWNVGLFSASSFSATIERLQLLNAQITGNDNTGGIVGRNKGTVIRCTATGTIIGNKNAGGISGLNELGIFNCSSLATVKGNASIGGLTGSNAGWVSYCYASGEVSGETSLGGLVGTPNGYDTNKRGHVSFSYWDKETTRQTSSAGSDENFGLTTADFANPDRFKEWDFNSIWEIKTQENLDKNARPYHRENHSDFKAKIEFIASPRGAAFYPSYLENKRRYGGEQITLTAEAKLGWKFEKWTADGKEIADAGNPYTFKLKKTSPLEYTAHFVKDYQFAGGEGTKENPYQIATLEQLRLLNHIPHLLDKHFILVRNIDASETAQWNEGKGFKPIGNHKTPFSGTFKGDSHSITMLTINRPEEDNVALFGSTKENAKVEKLQLVNAQISGNNNVGGIAGTLISGSIHLCSVSGKISGNRDIGGLVGYITGGGLVNRSYSLAEASGKYRIGGLVGAINRGKVEYCYAAGKVSHTKGASPTIGGLTGDTHYVRSILNSYWDKETSQQKTSAGSDDACGLTTAEFAKQISFKHWNFEQFWEIQPGADNKTRPRLQSELYACYIQIHESPYKNIGTIEGSRGYHVGEQATITAKAFPGFRFEKWTASGKEVTGSGSTYTFRITENNPTEYTAHFKEVFQFAGGKGTAEEPYQIASLQQLSYLSYVPALWERDKHFVLTNDIDASETAQWNEGKGFLPIGRGYETPFLGTFDGDGHSITNLTINRPKEDKIGLFGFIGLPFRYQKTKIKRLQLTNARINGKNYVGGIAGMSYGHITHCSVTGEIRGNDNTGGITGASVGKIGISHSYSLAKVSGNSMVGGLSGEIKLGKIEYSYAAGAVSGLNENGTYVGGITGRDSFGKSIEYSYWDKETTGQNASGGSDAAFGLTTAAFAQAESFKNWDFIQNWEIQKSSDGNPRPHLQVELYDFTPEIIASPQKGMHSCSGFKGYRAGEKAALSVNAALGWRFEKWTVNGKEIDGAGNPYTFTVKEGIPKKYTAHFVENPLFAGGDGTLGNPYQIATLEQLAQLSYFTSLLDKHFVLVNDIDATETAKWHDDKGFQPIGSKNSYFTGSLNGDGYAIRNLTINRPYEVNVGLFGRAKDYSIEKLQLLNVRIIGNANVGGLVGFNEEGLIVQCSTTGEVQGEEKVGGLVGIYYYLNNSHRNKVIDCYSLAKVMGKILVGGLIGENYSRSNILINAYAAGEVNCQHKSKTVLIGGAYNRAIILSSYWDKETTKQTVENEDGNAVGLSTADFANQSNFEDWNFKKAWEIREDPDGDGHSRPYLQTTTRRRIEAIPNNEKCGKITGAGIFTKGQKVTLEALPSEGALFSGWKEAGKLIGSEPKLSFTVSRHRQLEAVFEWKSFALKATVGSGGTVSSAQETVSYGHSHTFTFIPDKGYHVSEVLVNGKPAKWTNNQYTFESVKADAELQVTFAPNNCELTASAQNGTIAPAKATVKHGASQTFRLTPNEGHVLKSLKVNEKAVEVTGNTFTLKNIQDNQTVAAVFEPVQLQLNLKASEGGSLKADKTVYAFKDKATVTFRAKSGYAIQEVLYNGKNVTAQLKRSGDAWTFETPELTADGALSARFAKLLGAENNRHVQIAPNPVQKLLRVSSLPESARLHVTNLSGCVLQTVQAKDETLELDFSQYPSGIYFLKIEGGKTFKVIKR